MKKRLFLAAVAGIVGATVISHASSQLQIGNAAGSSGASQLGDLLGGLAGNATKPMEVGTGLILGRVVDGVGGAGVPGAIVTLSLSGFTPVRVQADSDGRFAFRALPKGTYNVSASRPGWVDGAVGRMRPGGAARGVTLSDDQRTGDIDIFMWRYASLSGTVLDEHNEPMVGVQVRVLRRDFTSGRRRLTSGPTDTTDDRGQFRIGTLEAGDYIVVVPIVHRAQGGLPGIAREGMPMGAEGGRVMAIRADVSASAGAAPLIMSLDGSSPPSAGTTEDGLPLTYQTEYYTGAVAASRATAITLTHGEERAGVDFRMTPVRALSVSGTVTGPEGAAANVQLQLLPADADDVTTPVETATTTSDNQGNFTFAMVPSGQYVLRALRQSRSGGETISLGGGGVATFMVRQEIDAKIAASGAEQPTLFAEMPLAVGTRDVTNVGVALRPGLKVTGSVTFTGSATQPTPEQRAQISILLEPADGRTADIITAVRGRVDAAGTFATAGVAAGKYILRIMGAPQGWSLRDASFGGRDISSTAVVLDGEDASNVTVTFTDKSTEVSGTVRDSSGNADVGATVLVFPADPSLWVDTGSQPRRLRAARVMQDGTYRVTGLPAGSYNILAVDDAATRNWQDPAALAQFARAASEVRLIDGDVRTQALTTTRGGR